MIFLSTMYEKGGGGVGQFERTKCSEMGRMDLKFSELISVENCVAFMKILAGCDEMVKNIFNEMRSIVDRTYL